MRTEQIRLEGLPEPLVDLDVDGDGGWVAVCGEARHATHIVFDGAAVSLPVPCLHPLIRLLGDGRALLVGTRSRSRSDENASIIASDGSIESRFHVGDAIEDVVVCGDRLVVTYFDEAFGAPNGLHGVVILDFAGKPVWRCGDILDCYCACSAGRGRVFFIGHPGFDAVLLDVTRGTRTSWPTPPLVHGSHAVTVAGDTAFFYAPYRDHDMLARWRFGDTTAKRIGTTKGPLRGLRGGRMLAVEKDRHAILSFEDELGV